MNKKKVYPWYFLSGALIIYFVLFFLPNLIGTGYSFTDWNSFDDAIHFVGLKNFKRIFSGNERYGLYILNTFVFTGFTTVTKTLLAFGLALLLVQNLKLQNFHRTVVFLPQVLSFVIVGLVFKSILRMNGGFINETLRSIGLGFMAQDWLGDKSWAFLSVMAVDIWKGIGFLIVIFIAGLKAIPKTYYEAAHIDGANDLQRLINITIPFMVPLLTVSVVLNITYGLRIFDIIYVLTNGGPGYATGVIYTAVYDEFARGAYSVGTALSTLLFIFIAAISVFIIRGLDKKEVTL
jgi:raffinose/stachyose/melibiose transport system permease protein